MKFTLFWTRWLLIKLNLFYLILIPTYVKTQSSIFAIAQIWFLKVRSTPIWFQKVQSIFISHNFHLRKEYDSHHPKPDLATSDGMTSTINTCFLIKFIYQVNYLLYDAQLTYTARERVNMATMAPPPPSTKSWQNMTRTRGTLAEKISADSWG